MERPPYYTNLAEHAEARQDWATAAHYWRKAASASLGHNKADRYEQRADRLEREHGLKA